MWTYRQSTGEMFRPDGKLLAVGYAGAGKRKNDPASQHVENEGPIPQGMWTIGSAFDSEKRGPICMWLTPQPGTELHGRADFMIHADSIKSPGTASKGCVVLPRFAREQIAASKDRALSVVP